MTALPVALDPWALATLDTRAEHAARQHGDTAPVVEQRHRDLLADLDAWQAARGRSYRDGRKNRSEQNATAPEAGAA